MNLKRMFHTMKFDSYNNPDMAVDIQNRWFRTPPVEKLQCDMLQEKNNKYHTSGMIQSFYDAQGYLLKMHSSPLLKILMGHTRLKKDPNSEKKWESLT